MMTKLTQVHRALPVSPARVYDYATDMLNYGNWFPGVIELTALDTLPPGSVGKRYREVVEMPTGRAELTIEVVEAIPHSRFVTHGDLAGFLPRMTLEVAEDGAGGCQVSLQYETRDAAMSANAALVAALGHQLEQRATAGLARLAELL